MVSFLPTRPLRPSNAVAVLALASSLVFAANGHAAGTAPQPPKQAPQEITPTSLGTPADSTALRGRAEAEKAYAKGWGMVEEAKKELAAGKTDAAKKRFGKALKKFDEATRIVPSYYQAWNMVGFCSRRSGDLNRAFGAYQKCLSIEPEYAEAHEYLGEAYLVSGDRAKAKEQLAWLRSRKSGEADELAEKIEAYEKGGAAAVEKASAPEKEEGVEQEGKETEEKIEK
jgi:Tfp pilus assembly protein PilF